MLKNIFLMGPLYISLLILIITDFFNEVPSYIQYGPIIVFGAIAIIVAILEMDVDEDEAGQKETGKENKVSLFFGMSLILPTGLLTAAMNVFVGEPKTDVFNIYDLSFWVFFVALPILNNVLFKIMEKREERRRI